MSTESNHPTFIRARGLDRIPLWKTAWRKWVTFKTVVESKDAGPFSQDEFLARWSAIHQAGLRTKDLRDMTRGFWKMESLAAAYARLPPRGFTLNDPRLPLEVRPIAHTGMGVGAVEAGRFDPARIKAIIESLANPNFSLFAYESLGAMLGAYEVPFPKTLMGLKPLRRPDPERFMAQFPPEIQWQISSGYGRILYFNNINIAAALRSIGSRPELQARAAVQGVAFAYAMVNHLDLWLVLETEGEFDDAEVKSAYRSGLIYALEFWEWETPGFLRSLQPPGRRSAELIAVAQREIEACLARGKLNSFLVENPVLTAP